MTNGKESVTVFSGWSGRSAHAERRGLAYRLEMFAALNNAPGVRIPPFGDASSRVVKSGVKPPHST